MLMVVLWHVSSSCKMVLLCIRIGIFRYSTKRHFHLQHIQNFSLLCPIRIYDSNANVLDEKKKCFRWEKMPLDYLVSCARFRPTVRGLWLCRAFFIYFNESTPPHRGNRLGSDLLGSPCKLHWIFYAGWVTLSSRTAQNNRVRQMISVCVQTIFFAAGHVHCTSECEKRTLFCLSILFRHCLRSRISYLLFIQWMWFSLFPATPFYFNSHRWHNQHKWFVFFFQKLQTKTKPHETIKIKLWI